MELRNFDVCLAFGDRDYIGEFEAEDHEGAAKLAMMKKFTKRKEFYMRRETGTPGLSGCFGGWYSSKKDGCDQVRFGPLLHVSEC